MSKKESEKELIISNFVQFLNLKSQFPYFKGASDNKVVADLVGLDHESYTQSIKGFDEYTKQAAIEILKDDNIKEMLENLPFRKSETFLLIGDVVSADQQGWFKIFQHVLELGIPAPRFKFINVSQNDMLTADAVKNVVSWLHIHKPTWVLVNLGTNDAQLMPIESEKTMLSLADTWENISALQAVFEETIEKPTIWLTPVNVVSDLVKESLLFPQDFSEEALTSIRQVISGKPGYVVDPHGLRLGQDATSNAWHYLADGVHHSISGHTETVKFLIKTLATSEEKDGKQLGAHLN